MPTTTQPPRIGYPPQPVKQRRRHRQRASSHTTRGNRTPGKFGFPQRQIGEVANNRADRGR